MDYKDIWYYIQGTYRIILYEYHPYLLRTLIKEQFEYRLTVMDKRCYEKGECYCECTVPDLQMSNKRCQLTCYPKFMNKNDWMDFKERNLSTREEPRI